MNIHEKPLPTFAHAEGAALLALLVAIAAALVTGEGRTFHAAAHLAAVLVPPAGHTRTSVRRCIVGRGRPLRHAHTPEPDGQH